MKSRYIFYCIITLVVISSCTKVVDVKLNNVTPQLVIQGSITNETGPYNVTISSTVNYDNSNVFPAISGAVVKITDDSTGLTDLLSEVSAGKYQTSSITQGKIGHTYRLLVQVNGKEYTAVSTMPKQVLLDSITFFTNTFFGTNATNPLPNFQDPASEENFYLFKQTVNKRLLTQNFLVDDRLSDGRYISVQLFNDSTYIKQFDTVQLEMRCVDKPVYNYFLQLSQITDPNGNQAANPTNPTSNIIGGALGYFSAYTKQQKQTVYK